MSMRIIVGSAVVASIVLHVALHSPISPRPLDLPSSRFPGNNLLRGVEKVGEGSVILPEDICVGKDGRLYTATRDGWIKRMHSNGSLENWKMIGRPSLLGLTPSMDGDIIVCDASQRWRAQRYYDAVEASDGSVYFTDASTKFGFGRGFYDFLEAGSNGRLLKYDPWNDKTTVVLPNLSFPNGVALSPNEDYLIISETLKFRCLRYWLRGERKGSLEVFIDNLPGGPDNINLAPDGSFWIACVQLRSWWMDLLHRSPRGKLVVAAFPAAVKLLSKVKKGALIVNVGADGKIRRMLDDSDGSVISFVTSALEHDGHIYLGSLYNNFIGKLPLNEY